MSKRPTIPPLQRLTSVCYTLNENNRRVEDERRETHEGEKKLRQGIKIKPDIEWPAWPTFPSPQYCLGFIS